MENVRYKRIKFNPFERTGLEYMFCSHDEACASNQHWQDIHLWMIDQFGPQTQDFNSTRYFISNNAANIWLRHEDDAFRFRLRWC